MRKNIMALMVLVLTGCVSKSTYRETVAEKDQQIKLLEDQMLTNAKDRGQLKNSLEEMKKALEEMRAREEEQKKRLHEFEDLTQRFKKLIDSGTLSVRIIDGKMVVSLGSDVLFPSGSAKLSKQGVQTIKDVTTQLASISNKSYQVEGHTDDVPIATALFPSNWELASARALSVVKTMVDTGMPTERVSAASYGKFHPVADNKTKEGKAANRRIEIVIVPDLSSLPGYEELQKLSDEQTKKN
ncbi:MAG: OmpA family protein [Bdellovibrionaceae bacterium]|nr:OmpA family protein [Pseudobdellovibrionaceae bacterium]